MRTLSDVPFYVHNSGILIFHYEVPRFRRAWHPRDTHGQKHATDDQPDALFAIQFISVVLVGAPR